jgi:phage shock protein PspC (stress-responsive transcriptional regulator)
MPTIYCKFQKCLPKFDNMEQFRRFVESHIFGVCTWMGDKMGVSSSTIRKYFIYVSCLTVGSPVVIYLFLAFWLNIKAYIQNARRNPLRHL